MGLLVSGGAAAQDWSELQTLTFTPETLASLPLERSLAAAATDFGAGSSGESVETVGADQLADTRGSAAPDEGPPEQIIARIRERLAAVEAAEAISGENSPELIPLLEDLAAVYEEIGDYADAFAALERAQHLTRLQHGLYSLDQAAIVERMIENDVAIAPGEESAGLESYLRELVQRNPEDPRVIRVLTDMAGRQMEMATYLLINGVPPEFVINIEFAGALGSGRAVEPPRTARHMASSLLRRARSNYATAMQAALRSGTADISQLLELESTIIDTYYFELMNPDLWRVWGTLGQLRFGGFNALNAKLANSRRYPGTPEAIANAYVELADWQLLFGSFGAAMREYEAARQGLAGQDVADEIVDGIFSPEAPVPLPAFAPNASVYADDGDVHGYVDVAIEINRFGGVRDVEILGGSADSSTAIERRLKRVVYQSRFRPRFIDGEWQRSDRCIVRYHFSYVSS